MAGGKNVGQPDPSQKAQGQTDARDDPQSQCEEIIDPRPCEHVFAHQKNRFGLFIRTIGIKRAKAKLTLVNLAYNVDRLIFRERRAAM